VKTVCGVYENVNIASGTYVAIGNFDGIHKGHTALIKALTKKAKNFGIPSVLYTFENHPVNVLNGSEPLKTLTTNVQKEKIVSALGVDMLFFDDFERVKDLTPEEFVKKILVDRFGAKMVFVGENNRFGKRAAGDAALLVELGKKYGFLVHVEKSVQVAGAVCSSSFIRQALNEGDIPLANAILGRRFSLQGTVIEGKKLGRTYGFPTINIALPPLICTPKHGVYATNALVGENVYPAITNVGTTSFDEVKIERIETHILNFDDDLYGKNIEIQFLYHLRDFIPFDNTDSLKQQLQLDKENRLKRMEEKS